MTELDNLSEYSNEAILGTSLYYLSDACARLELALSPLATRDTRITAIRQAHAVVGAVVEGLNILRERRSDPVLNAAQRCLNGEIGDDEFTAILVRATFALEGIEPTPEQFDARMAEFALLDSFIGRTNGQ